MRSIVTAALLAMSFCAAATADIRPDQAEFRGLYKELVETNTTLSVGSCTLAAERMAARLKAAGYADKDIRLFSVPDHPKEGGLVATLAGSKPRAKPILLLAHLDVVEAKREDWERDPFVLVEENGYFYGRGSSDDKAQGAIFTDALIRLKKAGTTFRRPLKLALTCGEESDNAFNGASWLANEHRDWIDAEFALNEGSVGVRDANGKPVSLGFEAGEKVYQDFLVEARNPGGHSSLPRPDNAIYSLAAALVRIGQYEFPVQFSDTTRGYFTAMAKLEGGERGAAIMRLLADPNDRDANAHRVDESGVSLHAAHHVRGDPPGRRPCPQCARPARHRPTSIAACFPAIPSRMSARSLIKAAADPSVTIVTTGEVGPTTPAPPLIPWVYDAAKRVAEKHFPGVPMFPMMTTGATDGPALNAVGIPTYGVPGRFSDPDGDGVHGLNERKSVQGLYEERDYLFDLIQVYLNAK